MEHIREVLVERANTHGHFPIQSMTAQRLKRVLHDTPKWEKLPDYAKEAVELICTKLARMTHGDYMSIEHAKDIAGYATLIVDSLKK